jgi:hypothetical protein
MKLKQRLGYLLSLLGAALMLSILLNVMSFQKMPYLQEDVPYNGDMTINRVRSESRDADSDNVAQLIEALRILAKHSPDGDTHSPGGADKPAFAADKSTYKEIVRKLLQDKMFNTNENVDNLINIGKLLEESVSGIVASHNDSGVIHRTDTSRDDVWDRIQKAEQADVHTEMRRYPGFSLDRVGLLTMSKHVTRHAERHREAKQKLKSPMTFKIHKGYLYSIYIIF